MMAVDVALNDVPEMGRPRFLFDIEAMDSSSLVGTTPQGYPYDVMRDGHRFVMATNGETTPLPTSLVLVQNFAAELTRLVPTHP